MRIRSSLLAVALLLAAQVAQAGARDQLQAFTKGLKGLDGQFTQQVFDPRGKQKERSTGRVAVSAPRLFRWEYAKPYPQVIVAVGNTSLFALTGSKGILRARGTWTQALGKPLLPMTHPAYLLRNPAAKREAWADLLSLQARLRG